MSEKKLESLSILINYDIFTDEVLIAVSSNNIKVYKSMYDWEEASPSCPYNKNKYKVDMI